MMASNTQESLDDSDIRVNRNHASWVAWHDEYTKWEATQINEFCKKRGLPILFK